MNTQHTPAPWTVQDNRWNGGQIRVDSETDGAVAILGDAQCHRAEVDTDARLISAAPELLAALKACQHEIENYRIAEQERKQTGQAECAASKQARAAIAKAEGQS